MKKEEAVALLERYSNYDGMGIQNLAGCKEAMRVAVDALKEACPELTESENERIRKALIEVFKKKLERGFEWVEYGIPNRSVLDWLEKQKENPKTSNSIPSDCTSNAKCEDRWHKVEDSLPDNGREVLAKDKLGNTLLARYDGEGWDVSVYDDEDYRCHNGISKWCEIPSEKQKEQKPWKVGANAYFTPEQKPEPVFKVGDKIKLKSEPKYPYREIVDIKNGAYYFDEAVYLPFDNQDNWEKEQKPMNYDHEMWKNCEANFEGGKKEVIEHPEKYGLQKSVEWSEEDEEILESTIDDLERYKKNYTGRTGEYCIDVKINWLKSLPKRFSPQPKQEWSEEDETAFGDLLWCIKQAAKSAKDENDMGNVWFAEHWVKNRLKSLRPQYYGDVTMTEAYKMGKEAGEASHWRPSEEQMKALEDAFRKNGSDEYRRTINSLYQDLKKL